MNFITITSYYQLNYQFGVSGVFTGIRYENSFYETPLNYKANLSSSLINFCIVAF